MYQLSALLAACCLIAAPLSAAERIPADCRWSVQLDAPTIAASRLGGWLNGLAAKAPWSARLKLLELATGFSLQRDLRAVTICGSDSGEENRLILLRGAFDPARLGTLAQALPGYSTETAYGRTIHVWADGAQQPAACLAESDLLIIGPTVERVKTAVAAHGRSPETDPAAGPALATITASDIAAWANDDTRSSPFGAISRIELRIGTLGDALELNATATAQDASAAQAIVDLGSQLMAMDHGIPAIDEALRSARLVGDGTQVSFHLLLSADGLQQLIARSDAAKPAGTPAAAPSTAF